MATALDVICHIPRRYQDRSQIKKVIDLEEEGEYQFILEVTEVDFQAYGKRPRLIIHAGDDSGELEILFFQGLSFWKNRFKEGQRLSVWGNAKFFYKWQLVHPEIQILKKNEKPDLRIYPIYPLTESMKEARVEHKFLQKLALNILEEYAPQENLPSSVVSEYQIQPEKTNYVTMHSPQTLSEVETHLNHLKIRELWPFCLELEKKKKQREGKGMSLKPEGKLKANIEKNLGFDLTQSQKEAILGISKCMESKSPMLALLQGDVGSGKTVVYMMAASLAVESDFQCAVLLPTEILAQQHFENFKKAFSQSEVKIGLLTGNVPQSERTAILKKLEAGGIHILLGTHALYSQDVAYKNLALVIVDEQHRFGVEQREKLETPNPNTKKIPHVLYVSATPIPRTLTQSLYGDFSVFSLTSRPQKNREIKTRMVPRKKRSEMLKFLWEESQKGNQIFWVVPRISSQEWAEEEMLESIPLKSLEEMQKELLEFNPEWKIGVLHGRLKPDEKVSIMENFKQAKLSCLVATTVIEVGVDVPNANILVIENPERYGLAQLHQLRGRIGRKGGLAWCFLAEPELDLPEVSQQRLEYLQNIEDGFSLAEKDLEMRGSGSLTGNQQSGFGFLKFTNLLKDSPLILSLRKMAHKELEALG